MTGFKDRGKHEVVTGKLPCHRAWEKEEAPFSMEVIVLRCARWSVRAILGKEENRLEPNSNIFIQKGQKFRIENCGFH